MLPFPLSQRRFILLSVLLLAAATALRAQENAATPLSLRDALTRAEQRNPNLAALAFHERATEAQIEQAGLRPNPTLEVEAENFAGTGALRDVRGLEATVQASQTFERGGKREKRVAVAARERDVAARDYAVRRADVLAGAAAAFVDVAAAQQRLARAAEPLQLARELLAITERRAAAGEASAAEVARAKASVATARADFVRAEAEFVSARAKLAATWGGTAAEVPAVAAAWQVPDELPTEGAFLAKLDTHPRLAREQAIVERRRATLELERAQATQDVTVGGGLRFVRDGSDAGFVAGVSVPLPMRNKNQGNIRAAREILAGAEQAVRATELELRASLTAAWEELRAAHAAVQSLRREALPATEDAHAVVRRAYDQGQVPLTDVFDAQRALVALRRDLLDAEIAFVSAHVRVEALVDATFPATTHLLTSR